MDYHFANNTYVLESWKKIKFYINIAIRILQKLSNFSSLNLFFSNVFFAKINDCLRRYFLNFMPLQLEHYSYSPNCSWSSDFFKHFFGIHGHRRIVLFLCHFGLATCGESYFVACSFAFLKSLHPVGLVSLKLKNKLLIKCFFSWHCPQFYIQLVFKAPLCITLTISDQKIVSGSLFFQLFSTFS